MLIAVICSGLVTFLNAKFKIKLNDNGPVDSFGSIYLFLIPSFIGAIYSSILQAIGASDINNMVYRIDSRFAAGGRQLYALLIAIGFGLFWALLVVLFSFAGSRLDGRVDFYNDYHYLDLDEANLTRSNLKTTAEILGTQLQHSNTRLNDDDNRVRVSKVDSEKQFRT